MVRYLNLLIIIIINMRPPMFVILSQKLTVYSVTKKTNF